MSFPSVRPTREMALGRSFSMCSGMGGSQQTPFTIGACISLCDVHWVIMTDSDNKARKKEAKTRFRKMGIWLVEAILEWIAGRKGSR